MPTPIEQALATLTPTLNLLPQDLVELATSLLAQSRAKAANLKPDEEIGRTYACAHIACERLKQQLGLDEKLQPRPPCPPRVYKKLYAYFDKALAAPTTPRTPRHKDALDQRSGGTGTPKSGGRTRRGQDGGQDGGQDQTPSKSRSAAKDTQSHSKPQSTAATTITASSATRKRANELVTTSTHGHELPSFIEPMITALCTRFSIPSAKPHILGGLHHVLTLRTYDSSLVAALETESSSAIARPSKRARLSTSTSTPKKSLPHGRGTLTAARLPALLIPLTLYVHHKLRLVSQSSNSANPEAAGETKISTSEYAIQRAMGIEGIRKLEEGHMQSDEELMSDVEGFMRAAIEEGRLSGDWFQGIGIENGGKQTEKSNEDDVEMEDAEMNNGERDLEDGDRGTNGDVAGGMDEEQATPSRTRRSRHTETPQEKGKGKAQAKTPLRRAEKHAPRPNGVADDADDDEWESAAGLKPGLGTMFQDAIDWLSEDRREEYKHWEEGIWQRIRRLEVEGIAA